MRKVGRPTRSDLANNAVICLGVLGLLIGAIASVDTGISRIDPNSNGRRLIGQTGSTRAAAQVVDWSVVTTVPSISMLWESVDAEEALTKRFGFATAASAADWVRDAVWESWAIAVDHCDRLVISAGNVLAWVTADDRRLIAKWSAFPWLFRRLEDTATLTLWLQASAIPVAAPVPAMDGRLRIEVENISLGVYPVVDGDLLDVEDPTQVTEAGRMLASLHETLAVYPHRIDGSGPTQHGQLVHNDFRSANLLHDGTRLRAVLDLEEVTYDTRVADLAKATVLLGTRYRNWGPTSRDVREAFVAAYHDEAPLTGMEQNELWRGITAIQEHFGWK